MRPSCFIVQRLALGAILLACLASSVAFAAEASGSAASPTAASTSQAKGSTNGVTMTFRREDYRGRGCLEYSWVPEGKRHDIVLAAGEATDSEHDHVPQDIHPSHVQVYALTNGKMTSPPWQFPPGPPSAHEIVSATVVVAASGKVTGTVEYVDGRHTSGNTRLDGIWRKCPTGLASLRKSTH